MKLLRELWTWLNKVPTEKPNDLRAFEESQRRVYNSSRMLDADADEIGKMIGTMQVIRTRRMNRKKVHQ